jgi:CHASE2 domain-containing sensor protein
MRKDIFISGCLGLVISILVFLLIQSPIFKTINLRCMDILFHIKPESDIHRDIAIIEIDDNTIEVFPEWQDKNIVYVKIIEMLMQAGARVIGIDLPWVVSKDVSQDKQLTDMIKHAKNVCLGFKFDEERQWICIYDKNAKRTFLTATQAYLPSHGLLSSAKSIGYTNISPDTDGVVRRIPLIIKYKDKICVSLPLRVALDGLNISRIGFGKSSISLDQITVIPTDKKCQMLINYSKNGTFRRYSFSEVISPKGDILIDTFYFRDKIVLLGVTAKQYAKFYTTPFSHNVPSIKIYAEVINNILNRDFLVRLPILPGIIMLSLIGISLGIILYITPYLSGVIITIGCCIIYMITSAIFFRFNNFYIDILPPIAVVVATFGIIALYKYIISLNDADRLMLRMRINEAKIAKLQRENEQIRMKLNPSFKVDFRTNQLWFPSTAQTPMTIPHNLVPSLRILECLVRERWGSDRAEVHWIEGLIIYHDSWSQTYPDDPYMEFAKYVSQLNNELFIKELKISKKVIVCNEFGYYSLNSNIRCESNVKSSIKCFKDAYELFQTNKLDAAEQKLKEAVEFDAENIRFLTLLGDIRYKLNKHKEAIESYSASYQVLLKEMNKVKNALNIINIRGEELVKSLTGQRKKLMWGGIVEEKEKIEARLKKLANLKDYLILQLLSEIKIMDEDEVIKKTVKLLLNSDLFESMRDEIYNSFKDRTIQPDVKQFERIWRDVVYTVIEYDIPEIDKDIDKFKEDFRKWIRYRLLEKLFDNISIESKYLHDISKLWELEDRFKLQGMTPSQEEVLKIFGWGRRYYYTLKDMEQKLQQQHSKS